MSKNFLQDETFSHFLPLLFLRRGTEGEVLHEYAKLLLKIILNGSKKVRIKYNV
jgi:hypothetical protein